MINDVSRSRRQMLPPEWARTERPRLLWQRAPRPYRFDGQTGEFYGLPDGPVRELGIQIFDWRWQEGERWGREKQTWLDLAFVDPEQAISVISLKKDSAIAVLNLLLTLQREGVLVEAAAVLLSAQPKSHSQGGDYYVVGAQQEGWLTEAQFQAVVEFEASGLFGWYLIGEVRDER